jgi:hypothetical protein
VVEALLGSVWLRAVAYYAKRSFIRVFGSKL